eukprot:scaffold23772_cov63-Phaeocystis_antarctica.AAC.5
MDWRQRYRRNAYSSGMASGHNTMKPTARAMIGWCAPDPVHSMSSDAVRKGVARKSERVTDGSTQNEMKTANSRLRSATFLIEPLRAALRAASASATASISTSGHSPLKARRVVSPPAHFQSGKMKLPKSKSSGSSTDSQSLSPLGKVLSKAKAWAKGSGVSVADLPPRDRWDQPAADYSGIKVRTVWRLTWLEAQGAARRPQTVPACLRPGRAGVACGGRQGAAERERRRSPEARRAACEHSAPQWEHTSQRGPSWPAAHTVPSKPPREFILAKPPRQGDVSPEVSHFTMSTVRFWRSTRGKHGVSADQRVQGSNIAVSHREAPSRWKQGNGGESEAGACAKHVVIIARRAGEFVSRRSSVVKRPCRAAAVVRVLGATASRFATALSR